MVESLSVLVENNTSILPKQYVVNDLPNFEESNISTPFYLFHEWLPSALRKDSWQSTEPGDDLLF